MTLNRGDLLFVGFDADNDDIAFITTVDIVAGEVIYFTDNEWDAKDFNSNKRLLKWTVPTGCITAGTVVRIDMQPNVVVNITGGNTNDIAVIGNSLTDNDTPQPDRHGLTVSNSTAIIVGVKDVLVPAIASTGMAGIDVDETINEAIYFYVLCADHMLLLAEGAPVEGMYLVQEAKKALSKEGRAANALIFPDVMSAQAVHKACEVFVAQPQQKALVARHDKNNKPALELSDG